MESSELATKAEWIAHCARRLQTIGTLIDDAFARELTAGLYRALPLLDPEQASDVFLVRLSQRPADDNTAGRFERGGLVVNFEVQHREGRSEKLANADVRCGRGPSTNS